MRRITMTGLCLLATFVVCAAAATTVLAAAPEYGRCKPVVGGAYKNAGCTVPAGIPPNQKKFEWYPGASGGSAMKSPGTTTVTFQVVPSGSGAKIKCAGEYGEDQYTGAKTVEMVMIFTSCKFLNQVCTVPGDNAGDIATTWVDGELGVYKTGNNPPLNNKIALDLKAVSGQPFFQPFSCGANTFKVGGEVMVPVTTNLMQQVSTLKFKATAGIQNPDTFVVGPIHILETEINGSSPEQVGLTFTTEDTSNEKIEVNSVY